MQTETVPVSYDSLGEARHRVDYPLRPSGGAGGIYEHRPPAVRPPYRDSRLIPSDISKPAYVNPGNRLAVFLYVIKPLLRVFRQHGNESRPRHHDANLRSHILHSPVHTNHNRLPGQIPGLT